MNPKIFHGLLSAIIGIPFLLSLHFMSINPYDNQLMIFIITMGFLSGIPAVILSIIHVVQIELQKKKENKKNDSKTSPDVESTEEKNDPKPSPEIETTNGKNLLGMIQKRLAKGEISVQEFQALKKEISC